MPGTASSIFTDDAIIRIISDCSPERRQAENQFFKRYSYFIREGMRKYSLCEEDAFTAYSDSVLDVLKNIDSSVFEGRSSLKTYLYKIFQNKCVDLIRKNTTNKSSVHRASGVSETLIMLGDKAKNILQRLIEKNEADLIKAQIEKLSVKCRDILLLFSEGFKDKEVANYMDLKSAAVVKTTRLRCLQKLRELYKRARK